MKALKDAIRKVVSVPAEKPAPTPGPRPESAYRYFFISGHPRSGTNWLSNLCNLHPDICCHGEFHFQVLYNAFDRFTDMPWYVASKPKIKAVAREGLAQTTRRCMIAMAEGRKPGATVIGDHTPRPFQMLLGDSAYLAIIRDGRDVVVSWTFHLLRTGKPGLVHDRTREAFTRELAAAGDSAEGLKAAAGNLLRDEAWVSTVAGGWALQMQNDLPRLRGLIETPRNNCRVLLLRYEELLGDAEKWRTEIYRFLGVEPGKAESLSRETNTVAGFGREDPQSFYRKGESGDWKNYFDAQNATWFKTAAGKELIEAGYEKDLDW